MINEDALREEILKTFHKNYMVEAGAGAGKTSLIIKRIINQITTTNPLIQRPLKIEEIAAITFTEKAAGELKSRVAQEIDKAIYKCKEEETLKLLEEAKLSLDDQYVGTIHSFCRELLSSNVFDAGVGLDFKIIDQLEDQNLKDRVWRKYIDKNLDSLDDIIPLMDEEKLNMDDAKNVFNVVTNYEASMVSYGEFKGVKDEIFSSLKKRIDEILGVFQPLGDSFSTRDFVDIGSVLNKEFLKSAWIILRNMEDPIKRPYFEAGSIISNYVRTNKSGPFNKRSKYGKELEINSDLEGIADIYHKYNVYRYNLLMNVAMPAREDYSKYKKDLMLLNFDDLLIKTRNLVRNSKAARERIRERYKCLYIDEFQDTDSIQSELVFYLYGEGEDLPWQKRKLIPGSTFIVGDPKQSIYRFRGADIDQYNKVKEIFENDEESRVIHLKRNYRTGSNVIDFVSDVFMVHDGKEDIQGETKFLLNTQSNYQASFFGMDPFKIVEKEEKLENKKLSGVYRYYGSEKPKMEEARMEEAKWVTGFIKKMVNEKYMINSFNENEDEFRSIKYSDFLILTYNTIGMIHYINELKNNDIPLSYAGKINLGSIEEVANFIDLLECISNPYDDLILANILINCYGINNLEDYTRYVDERGKKKNRPISEFLFNDHLIDKEDDFFKAIGKLKEYIDMKDKLLPIPFIKIIIQDLELVLTKKYNVTMVKSIMGTIHYLIEKLSTKNLVSFQVAVRELVLLKDTDNDREMLIQHPYSNEGNDYVRIMNLHKAKGLEGHIVILSTSNSKMSKGPQFIVKKREEENELFLKIKRDNKTLGYCKEWIDLEGEEIAFLKGEELRLQYVASTRGINALLISDRKRNHWKDQYDQYLDKSIPFSFVDIFKETPKLSRINKEGLSTIRDNFSLLKKEKNLQLSKPNYTDITPSSLGDKYLWKINVEDIDEEGDFVNYNGPVGDMWGNLVHRAFELVFTNTSSVDPSFCKEVYLNKIDSVTDRAIYEFKNDADFSTNKDILCSILTNFMNNSEVSTIISSGENIIPELNFEVRREKYGKVEYVSGIADLVVQNDQGIYIIDYKSNNLRKNITQFESILSKAYMPQLKLYKEFFQEQRDLKVLGTYIYSTVLDRLIRI